MIAAKRDIRIVSVNLLRFMKDVDTMIADHPWNNIRLWSGGNGALYYFDDIVIERGVPLPPPVSYCFGDGQSGVSCPCGNQGQTGEGCANSSGMGGLLTPGGSASVAADGLFFEL